MGLAGARRHALEAVCEERQERGFVAVVGYAHVGHIEEARVWLHLEPRDDLRQQPGQHRLEAVAAVARRVLVAAAQAFHAARVRTVLARVR